MMQIANAQQQAVNQLNGMFSAQGMLGGLCQIGANYGAHLGSGPMQWATPTTAGTADPYLNVAPVTRDSGYAARRAKEYVEQGERLIERIAFWRPFGWLGSWVLERLVERLEYITSEMERWHEMSRA